MKASPIFDRPIAFLFERVRESEMTTDNPRARDLCLCGMDGKNVIKIADNVPTLDFYWTPDGKRITFESTQGKERKYLSIDAMTGESQVISFNQYIASYRLSPDGRYIAYSNRDNVYITDAVTETEVCSAAAYMAYDVEWLRDGRLGYRAWINPKNNSPQTGYYVIKPDDGKPLLLSPKAFDVGNCEWSPDGKYLAFRKNNGLGLFVMPLDVEKVWAITATDIFISGIRWSPDGARLAANVTDGDRTGLYVFDLLSGKSNLVAPDHHLFQQWTPDGKSLLTFLDRWEDDTYKVTLDDVCLVAADGSGIRELTSDGRSSYPKYQPAQSIVYPQPELTFDWAKVIFSKTARTAEVSTADPLSIARWAELLADPSTNPPFTTRIGIQSTPAAKKRSARVVLVKNCAHIPDAIDKIEAKLRKLNISKSENFALIYPRFAVDDSLESTAFHIAHLISEEARHRNWAFERELPQPDWD